MSDALEKLPAVADQLTEIVESLTSSDLQKQRTQILLHELMQIVSNQLRQLHDNGDPILAEVLLPVIQITQSSAFANWSHHEEVERIVRDARGVIGQNDAIVGDTGEILSAKGGILSADAALALAQTLVGSTPTMKRTALATKALPQS